MSYKKILILVVAIILVAVGINFFLQGKTAEAPVDLVACTMEAKICPDGSAVGRIAPDCEFEICPNESTE